MLGAALLVLLAVPLAVVVRLAIAARARVADAARLAAPGRAMGLAEAAFDEMHHMGAFIIGITAEISGGLDPEVLRRALDTVQARHPLLSVHALRDDGLFRGDGTLPIPLRVVAAGGEDAWRRELLREVGTPIPYGRSPLVRATWIEGVGEGEPGRLIVVANHAVFDGASAIAMLRDVLHECGGTASPGTRREGPFALAPMDARLGGRAVPARPKEEKPALLPLPPKTHPRERRPRFDVARLDAQTMERILARCRKEETTFNGLVSAASLLALAEAFHDDGERGDRTLSLSSNISVRRELSPPVPDDAIGCFISGVTTAHRVTLGAEPWALSRDVRGAITGAMAESRHLSVLAGDFTTLHRLGLRHVVPNVSQGRLNALNVSNSGRFELARDHGPLRLEGLYFMSTQALIGSVLQVAVVTLGGELFVTFSFGTPFLSDAQAATAKSAFLRILNAAAN